MKKIAIIFKNSPYGSHVGREGLNLALSISCYIDNIGIFFIGDGIFQILDHQKPDFILSKPYYSAFKVLTAHNIKNLYLCYDSLLQHGLHKHISFSTNAQIFTFTQMRYKIKKFDFILNF